LHRRIKSSSDFGDQARHRFDNALSWEVLFVIMKAIKDRQSLSGQSLVGRYRFDK
jgi:hypothetical protein